MKKRSSALARILAALAVVGGFVLIVVVLSTALGDDGDSGAKGSNGSQTTKQSTRPKKNVPATYVVKGGDTLLAIAHSTGVTVVQIERLNPGIDPQILSPGEKLKLK